MTKERLLAVAQTVQIVQLTHERGKMMLYNASEICINLDTVYMGIPDHLTCLWETYMQVKKQQLEPCMEQLIGSRSRKEYHRTVCCHPVRLTCTLRTLWKILGWDELQAGIKIGEKKNQQPQIWAWYHCNGRKQRGSKEPLDGGEAGEWKSQLKLNIKKTKIMASGPITAWQIEGERWK